MRNIRLVINHEIRTVLRQRSFWIFTLIMPALILGINTYYAIRDSGLDSGREAATEKTTDKSTAEKGKTSIVGLVDETGLITEIPANIPAVKFVRFPDLTDAHAALQAEQIEQYIHIAADYVATGDVTVYDRNFQILQSGENMGVAFGSMNEWVLGYLINANLTGDEKLVMTLRNPVPGAYAEHRAINPPGESDEKSQALAQVVANVMPFIFYFIFIVTSGYVMRAVTAEKENRTVEVLLLSVRPYELMAGKIMGLGTIALAQLGVWVGSAVLVFNWRAELGNLAELFTVEIIIWAILFLAFGFLLYASVMAAAGAMAPTAREGGQVTWLLLVPLLPTLMFGSAFFENPHGTLSIVLSLIPFSAPSAMVTRLAVAEIPIWQPIVSLLGVALTSYLMVRLAGRFFRAGNLLSSTSFNWGRFATGWRD